MSQATRDPHGAGLRRARLIAFREFRERVGQKAYRISLVLGMIAAAVAVVLPTLFGDDDGSGSSAERVVVAFSGAGTLSGAQLTAAADGTRGAPLRFVRVRDEAAARKAVGDGDESLGLVVGGTATDPTVAVLLREDGGGSLASQAAQAVDLAAQRARLEDRGSVGEADEVFRPASVTTQVVAGGGPSERATGVAAVLGLLLYLAGIVLVQAYANGIVSDRTNHVTERLLTAARPWEHLSGKLVGVGAAGILQFFGYIAAAVIASAIAGSGTAFDGVPIELIIFFPIGLVLSYVLYSAMATILVLPVRKTEDVGSAVAPAIILQIVAFSITSTIVAPGVTVSSTVEILSLIPFFSPLIMLGRLAGGDVPAWELAVAIAGPLLLAAILLRIAAPAYARYAIDAPGGKGLKAALGSLRR